MLASGLDVGHLYLTSTSTGQLEKRSQLMKISELMTPNPQTVHPATLCRPRLRLWTN
jgi:hypothetical protein